MDSLYCIFGNTKVSLVTNVDNLCLLQLINKTAIVYCQSMFVRLVKYALNWVFMNQINMNINTAMPIS